MMFNVRIHVAMLFGSLSAALPSHWLRYAAWQEGREPETDGQSSEVGAVQ